MAPGDETAITGQLQQALAAATCACYQVRCITWVLYSPAHASYRREVNCLATQGTIKAAVSKTTASCGPHGPAAVQHLTASPAFYLYYNTGQQASAVAAAKDATCWSKANIRSFSKSRHPTPCHNGTWQDTTLCDLVANT